MNILVKKRDGTLVPLDIEKIHQVVEWACENIRKVSVSEIELNANLQFHNKIKTSDIQKILVKSAVDLISTKTSGYELVAGRLLLMDLRKKVYRQFDPLPFETMFYRNIENNLYDKDILKFYSKEEIVELGKYIKYDRDLLYTYASLQQLIDKYLIQSRNDGTIYECPQEMFMVIGMYMFQSYKGEAKLKLVKELYDNVSKNIISLPTPIISGVRTKLKQFASCCVIDVDDTKESINSSKSAVALYTAARSGIGINWRLRGVDAKIRGGEVLHTGITPFLKSYDATTKEWTQNGVRGGGATNNFAWFHWEIEDIIHLKNNKGIENNRVRGMDYCIHIDSLLLERASKNEKITLFSYEEIKDLYEEFYKENGNFRDLYEKYEKKSGIRKKKIEARQFLLDIITERFETGRIYILFVDNVKGQNRFDVPVYTSNLCMEILLPTKPIQHIDDKEGEIATCILSCVNLGRINSDAELESACSIIVRFLDALIDYQDYPVAAAQNSTLNRRNLGIGISDYFHFLAKRKLKYDSQEALDATHEIMEKFQYYLIKTSVELAKEKGPCALYKDSKYSRGILPIDLYNKNVDLLTTKEYVCDWESLRKDLLEHGIRHSVLTAIPPTASSSLVSNSSPGVDPVRDLMIVKVSKKGTLKQLVPDFDVCGQRYVTAWDIDNIEYLKLIAVIQKFIDQSISTNTFYDIRKYTNNKVPVSQIISEIVFCQKYGIKSLYYSNTNDNSGDKGNEEDTGCPSGACAI